MMQRSFFQSGPWIVFLLFTGTLISAIDRGSISTAGPEIMKDLRIDPAQFGVILSAFFWAYLAMNIPAGLIADRIGPKTTLALSGLIYSMFTAATGLVSRVGHLILVRLGVGAGEAATLPCNTRIVRATFVSEQRGTAMGWYLSGFRLGFALSPVAMAYLISHYSWRRAFYISGVLSAGWVVLWCLTYVERRDRSATATATTAAPVRQPAPATKIRWSALLRHRTIVGLVLCKFFQDYTYYLFVTWLPGYLILQRGFSLIKSGWYAAIPWIAAFVFQPLAGGISDGLLRRGVDRTIARKAPIIVMQLLATVVVAAGYARSAVVAVWLLAVSLVFESGSAIVLWTVCAEVAPDEASASVAGIMNTAGALAGILAPIITGVLLKYTGSFNAALLVGGLMFVCGALSMCFVVGKVETIALGEAESARALSGVGC
jgi:ACS family glucarate transporter-like MFS transporter